MPIFGFDLRLNSGLLRTLTLYKFFRTASFCIVLFCIVLFLCCMSPSAGPYLNIFLVEDVAKTSETTTVVDVWTQLCNQQTSEIGTRRKNKSRWKYQCDEF